MERIKHLLLCAQLSLKNLNLESSRRHLADYVNLRTLQKSVPHVQHGYFPSFNQWDHCFLESLLRHQGVLEMTTGKATLMPQINDVIGWKKEKQLCCTCGTLFGVIFWRCLSNGDAKFSFLRCWRQREPAAVNRLLKRFSIDDGNCNSNAPNKKFDWSTEEK